MGGVPPATPAEAFCPAFGWLGLGASADGAAELVAMFADAAALALIAAGEAFATTAWLLEFSGNGLRLATAEKNGLDGTVEVVTHPARATASATAIKERPVRTHLRANAKRTLAAPKQRGRTCSPRLLASRSICEEHSLGTFMFHYAESEHTDSTALLIFHYR
jgi:hypothetical protein